MKFSDLKKSILAQFEVAGGNRIVPFIEGKPGGGKSACAREIVNELKKKYHIADEQIVEFNPSLRDPVDVLGVPFKHESGTHNVWLPPEEFYNLRQGVGPCALIIEELTDAPMSMQNPMCRIILDRWAGSVKLSDQLFIIATGNRVEDKSGANRMSTKLGNRLRCLPFDENLDDWITWAKAHNICDVLIKFLQFQPKMLSDFDPTRKTNPTPRAWEAVSLVPSFTGRDGEKLFHALVAGDVGEGAAAAYCAFRKMYLNLPDFSELLARPEQYAVPEDLSIRWATVMKLVDLIASENCKQDTANAALTFISRVPPDMQAMAVRELYKGESKKRLIASPVFKKLASRLTKVIG